MDEISDAERYCLNGEMREGAIELEGAENGEGTRRLYRQDRRALEAITDRETIVRRLKELDGHLGVLGGEDEAVTLHDGAWLRPTTSSRPRMGSGTPHGQSSNCCSTHE
jgi:hypothetical protein